MRYNAVPISDDVEVCSAEKMRAGIPLTDADRWPWLRALAELIDQHLSSGRCLVMACSALKDAYRDVLRGKHAENVTFVSSHCSSRLAYLDIGLILAAPTLYRVFQSCINDTPSLTAGALEAFT